MGRFIIARGGLGAGQEKLGEAAQQSFEIVSERVEIEKGKGAHALDRLAAQRARACMSEVSRSTSNLMTPGFR
jgi:hypothetical protein